MRTIALLRKKSLTLLLSLLTSGAFSLGAAAPSHAVLIDFESVTDNIGLGVTVTNQFSAQGVIFANATGVTAQLSLNEIDFPAHSGNTVLTNANNLVLRLDFSSPLLDVGGFFTYSLTGSNKLRLQAFDINGNSLGTKLSAFSDNTAGGFGDPGSSPNEFLQLSGLGAIRRLDINGFGGSFTLDDLQFTPGTVNNQVAEPGSSTLLLFALLAMAYRAQSVRKR